MGRTIVTAKSTCSLYGVYKCSRCGKIVCFDKNVSSYGESSRGGLWHSDKMLDPLRQAASEEANNQLPRMVMSEINMVKQGVYKTAFLDCSCDCGNKEIWASFYPSLSYIAVVKPSLFKFIFGAAIAILFLVVIALLTKSYIFAIIGSLLLIGATVYFLIVNNLNERIQNQCLSLQDANRPHLFISEKDREGYIHGCIENKNDGYKDLSNPSKADEALSHIEQIFGNRSTVPSKNDYPVFCHKCGCKLLPESEFCSKCGAKVR